MSERQVLLMMMMSPSQEGPAQAGFHQFSEGTGNVSHQSENKKQQNLLNKMWKNYKPQTEDCGRIIHLSPCVKKRSGFHSD